MSKIYVIGVGVTKFVVPPSSKDYDVMGYEAALAAVKDSGVDYKHVEGAVCGYCYGDPTCGQRVVYQLGLTGVPILNVNNNCSTGSTALWTARMMVQAGKECVLAVGFEKMERGNLTQKFSDSHQSPTQKHFDSMFDKGMSKEPIDKNTNDFTGNVIKLFAGAQTEHMKRFGSSVDDFSLIAYKNHKHSKHNPYAAMQMEIPLQTIAKSKALYGPILRMQACPVACGAAAAVLCSESFVRRNNLQDRAVCIAGQALVTDVPGSFDSSIMNLAGYGLAKMAAQKALKEANTKPSDVQVVECHDCFSCNELFMYEALGLCGEGEGHKLLKTGQWKKTKEGGELFFMGSGGGVVVNPSGGLESKGHPIGATGLAQCAELVWQLRGQAGKRQVPGASVGLQHNFGLGSACVVTVYKRENAQQSKL